MSSYKSITYSTAGGSYYGYLDYSKQPLPIDYRNLPSFSYTYSDLDKKELEPLSKFRIEKLVFNGPATIVFWKDGTKTIVKCDPEDRFDPYKGIALCFMKKARGNKGNYNDVFRTFDEEITDALIEHGIEESNHDTESAIPEKMKEIVSEKLKVLFDK